MKVKDLINELKGMDSDAVIEVAIKDSDGESKWYDFIIEKVDDKLVLIHLGECRMF